jgi:MFS transporter, DHA2 family, multidrug resistance protein
VHVTGTTADGTPPGTAPSVDASNAPKRAGVVLAALIAVAAVANLGLAVANVALPSIGQEFDASQTALNLVAVGYSLGLAASVLYFGAVGDRYGRKLLLILGMVITVPADCLAAWAPSIGVLFGARVLGGLAAGMAYPTTLALITALWSGPARTRAIALWAATGGAISALGPLCSGILLQHFWWGSVFLLTLPLAAIALVMALLFVPSHVNETTEPVDNLGGVLSIFLVGALILGINFAPVPNEGTLTLSLLLVAAAALIAFYLRQRRAPNPLYDLRAAARPTFWVAACAGLVVFGSLMGAMYIGQQFLQNVLDYSTVDAGLAILPAAFFMVIVAPRSAKLVERNGARLTLLYGYVFVLLGFLTMLLLWKEDISYWKVALGYSFVGIGVGLAGTPASHSLTGSVPVKRVGMASGTADLQRDLGGAVMQSIFGAFLTAGYASATSAAITASGKHVSSNVQSELTKSFSSAADTAKHYPPSIQDDIIAAAKTSFLHGDQWAYLAGIVAVLLGATLVFFMFPKRDDEQRLLAEYQAKDAAEGGPAASAEQLAAVS